MQKAVTLDAEYRKKYPIKHPDGPAPAEREEVASAAPGYSDSYDHFHNFFNSVRSRKPVVRRRHLRLPRRRRRICSAISASRKAQHQLGS